MISQQQSRQSACADAQADQRLCCLHMSEDLVIFLLLGK